MNKIKTIPKLNIKVNLNPTYIPNKNLPGWFENLDLENRKQEYKLKTS